MKVTGDPVEISQVAERLFSRAQEGHNSEQGISPGWLFKGLTMHFHQHNDDTSSSHRLRLASNLARFGGASIVKAYDKRKGKGVTHVVVDSSSSIDTEELSKLRTALSAHAASGQKMPHLVTVEWVEESWEARTLVDEESMSSHFLPAFTFAIPGLSEWNEKTNVKA
jgi:DNA ligase-4